MAVKRLDLAHTSCGICGEGWQTPEPPDMPEGYLEAVEYLGRLAIHEVGLDPDKVAASQRVLDEREAQAAAYRLDEDAFKATHDHAEKSHTLDEHLEHAHAHRIPLTCEKCSHQEQATAKGLAALKTHKCHPGKKQPAYSAE